VIQTSNGKAKNLKRENCHVVATVDVIKTRDPSPAALASKEAESGPPFVAPA
jgi:hypothetical protein